MATSLITRETPGGGATVKNAPLTNEEVDNNFISLSENKVEIIEGTVAVIPNGTTGERPATPSVGMLRFNTTEEAFEGYNGTEWGTIGGGGGVAYTFQTANYTAEAGEGVLTDTTGGAFTVTLPASPEVGATVVVADAGGAWGTNNLTIARNGSTIDDTAEDLVLDIDGVSVTLVYDGTTWEVYAQAGVNTAAGAEISDDTTSTDDFYPTLAAATSGQFSDATVSSTKLFFQPSTGTLNATEFNSLSDAAVKSNIAEIDNGLDVVTALSGVEFDWTDNGNHSAGVVAQDLERVLPHLVSTSSDGMKSVNYAGLTAYLLSAVKELSSRLK